MSAWDRKTSKKDGGETVDPGVCASGTRRVAEVGGGGAAAREEQEPSYASFEDVYRDQKNKNLVWRMLKRADIPDDLAETIHGKVFCTMHTIIQDKDKGMPKKVRAMLRTITGYEILNFHKLREKDVPLDDGADVEAQRDSRPDPLEALLEREEREQLDGLLDQMPERARNRIQQVDLVGLTYEEIAEATETPVATIRIQHRRARTKFVEMAKRFFKVGGGK